MTRTRVKICGITTPDDAKAAVAAGADALGLVFYAPSPRSVTIEQALAISAVIPPFVSLVALVVNAQQRLLEQIITALPVSLLQFHGDESPADCERYKRPYIKALAMRDGVDPTAELARFSSAQALLLDAFNPALPGGTGEQFDWQRIPAELSARIILAGGLHPANVAAAITMVGPYAVDVSSGVEVSPGVKDRHKLLEFIGNVGSADRAE